MKLTHEDLEGGVYKITLEGPIDLDGSAQIDPHFKMVADKYRRVVVDLSGVDFLASIGIRVLVKSAKTIAEQAGRMAVFGAQEAPRRVLETTGVDKIVMLVQDEPAALAWVRK